jgi:hypothetical protein
VRRVLALASVVFAFATSTAETQEHQAELQGDEVDLADCVRDPNHEGRLICRGNRVVYLDGLW